MTSALTRQGGEYKMNSLPT